MLLLSITYQATRAVGSMLIASRNTFSAITRLFSFSYTSPCTANTKNWIIIIKTNLHQIFINNVHHSNNWRTLWTTDKEQCKCITNHSLHAWDMTWVDCYCIVVAGFGLVWTPPDLIDATTLLTKWISKYICAVISVQLKPCNGECMNFQFLLASPGPE